MPKKTDVVKLMKLHKSIIMVIPYWIARELDWKVGDRIKINIFKKRLMLEKA